MSNATELSCRRLFESMSAGSALYQVVESSSGDIDLWFIEVNAAFARLVGTTPSHLMGKPVDEAMANFESGWLDMYRDVIRNGRPTTFECSSDDGQSFYHVEVFRPEPGILAAIYTDISESKHFEAERAQLSHELLESKKMEAIGLLASGIGHEFNNLLQGIVLHAGLAETTVEDTSAVREALTHLRTVVSLAERGSEITKGLLAYDRRTPVRLVPVEMNMLVSESVTVIARVIGEDISLEPHLASERLIAAADSSAMRQAITNLVINARAALPSGGTVQVKVNRVEHDLPFTAKSTHYVGISVSARRDISPEPAKDRPNNEPLEGVGVGLWMVFAIIKQHGGFVDVATNHGSSPTITLCLPLTSEQSVPATRSSSKPPSSKKFAARVLVVDDEDSVREVICLVLKRAGFETVGAGSGDEAIHLLEADPEVAELAVLDMVMPGKNGRETLAGLREIRPDIKAVFMSGYSQMVNMLLAEAEGTMVLMKPVGARELLRTVKSALTTPNSRRVW